MKKIGKKKIIVAIGLIVIVIGTIMISNNIIKKNNNPINKTFALIKDNDFESAKIKYEGKVAASYKAKGELSDKLLEYADELKEKIKTHEVKYENVEKLYNFVCEINLEAVQPAFFDLLTFAGDINTSNDHFANAEALMEENEYLSAIDEYSYVIEDDINYEKAVKRKKEATESYKQSILDKAKSYAENEQYDNALEVLYGAVQKLEDDKDIKDIVAQEEKYEGLRDSKIKTDGLKEAKDKYAEGSITEAIDILKNYMSKLDCDEFDNLYSEYYNKLLSEVKTTGEDYLKKDGWEKAYNYILDYYDYLQDSEEFQNLYQDVLSYAPIYLAEERAPFNEDDILGISTYYDRKGNEFERAFIMYAFYSDTEHEWYLNKEFSKLEGTLAFSNDDDMATGLGYAGKIEIYCDDKLVYKSPDINPKSDPIPISIDIKGVEYIKICNSGECEVIVDSLTVYKKK